MSPDGHAYRGVVDIVRHADTYQVMWILPTEQHLGLGIVTEDGHNLAVSYFGSEPGIVLYRIVHDDGGARLLGQWTAIPANGRVYTETLTRIGPGSGHLYFRVLPHPPIDHRRRGGRPT